MKQKHEFIGIYDPDEYVLPRTSKCWREAIIQYDTDKDKFINVKTNREHMRIIQVNCNLAI